MTYNMPGKTSTWKQMRRKDMSMEAKLNEKNLQAIIDAGLHDCDFGMATPAMLGSTHKESKDELPSMEVLKELMKNVKRS